jgi:hypothetical protein
VLQQGFEGMKLRYSLLVLSLALGGCSSSGVLNSLGMGSSSPTPASSNIQVGNNLAMPPDLQLKAPGTGQEPVSQAPIDQATANEPVQSAALDQPVAAAPAPRAPTQDVYAKYGISKTKPDGTAKSDQELKAELKKAILAEKRKTQPGYGTIGNIGNIFSDG